MVDLTRCKPGDKLRSKHGMILTYVKRLPEGSYYDHMIQYPDGSFGTRTNEGFTYRNISSRLETDHDVVEILKGM